MQPTQDYSSSEAHDLPPSVWGQAVFNGNVPGHEAMINLTQDEVTFGRKATCTVRLHHPGTSSLHCKLRRMGAMNDNILMVTDLSTNGIFTPVSCGLTMMRTPGISASAKRNFASTAC